MCSRIIWKFYRDIFVDGLRKARKSDFEWEGGLTVDIRKHTHHTQNVKDQTVEKQ